MEANRSSVPPGTAGKACVLFTAVRTSAAATSRILYGGGDSYVLAADVSQAELLAALA